MDPVELKILPQVTAKKDENSFRLKGQGFSAMFIS
jgi:hypothetical protein